MPKLPNLKVPVLFLLLVTPVSFGASFSAGSDDALKVFWKKFKRSVIAGELQAVASLSRLPLALSFGKRSIKSRAEFIRRYREIFNEQTDAAQCFTKKEPELDHENPERFSVACPDEAGNEVVI